MVDMQVGDGVKGVIGYQRPIDTIEQAAEESATPDGIVLLRVWLAIYRHVAPPNAVSTSCLNRKL